MSDKGHLSPAKLALQTGRSADLIERISKDLQASRHQVQAVAVQATQVRVPVRAVLILAVALAQVFYAEASYTDFK